MKEQKVEEVIDTIEVKGKTYSVYQGKKGGKYYYNDKGKKAYVKEETAPQPKVTIKTIDVRETPNPEIKKQYIGFFHNVRDNMPVDDFKEICEAYNEAEAQQIFEERYQESIAYGNIELAMIWEDRENNN